VQSLERDLQRDAARHGMASIGKVTKAEVKNGVLRVHVQGRELRRPKLAMTPEQAEREWATVAPAKKPGLRQPVIGPRPIGPGR
jgi:hypothetical protein